MIRTRLIQLLDKLPPQQRDLIHRRLMRLYRPAWLGTIRRVSPVSEHYGYDRGTPVDRYYIETFLDQHRQDIAGHVLEVKDSGYTDRFGTAVTRCSVLDIDPANPQATVVADLATADSIPTGVYDCFILTQVLQMIYDLESAVQHACRILRPGGVLLVTVPCLSRIIPREGIHRDFWRFTAASCRKLFGDVFGAEQVSVYSYGNVLSSVAFLMGLGYEELSRQELDAHDPYFPMLVAVRAVKR